MYLSKKKVDANNVESSGNVLLSKIPIKKNYLLKLSQNKQMNFLSTTQLLEFITYNKLQIIPKALSC